MGRGDERIARELGLPSRHVTHAIQQLYSVLNLWDDPDEERLPRVRLAAWWARQEGQ